MDCYYHHAVPSITRCRECDRSICASCRDDRGMCSGCRLGERIDAARSVRELRGTVPPRSEPRSARQPPVVVAPVESRALVALGYPFWPLAVIALLDGSKSPFIRRHACQALAFNLGISAFGFALLWLSTIPFIGWSAVPIAPLIVPFTFVANCVYGFKAWHGEDFRIPVISDWLDRRMAPTR